MLAVSFRADSTVCTTLSPSFPLREAWAYERIYTLKFVDTPKPAASSAADEMRYPEDSFASDVSSVLWFIDRFLCAVKDATFVRMDITMVFSPGRWLVCAAGCCVGFGAPREKARNPTLHSTQMMLILSMHPHRISDLKVFIFSSRNGEILGQIWRPFPAKKAFEKCTDFRPRLLLGS
jgi:hypothetical protein